MKKGQFFIPTLVVVLLMLFSSCGFLFRQAITPHHCKKCEVKNDSTGNVVWSEDGCGGSIFNMELRGKAEAYDRGCHYKLHCEEYRESK